MVIAPNYWWYTIRVRMAMPSDYPEVESCMSN